MTCLPQSPQLPLSPHCHTSHMAASGKVVKVAVYFLFFKKPPHCYANWKFVFLQLFPSLLGLPVPARKGNELKSFKRKKGETFLLDAGVKVQQGMWASDETIVFAVLLKFLLQSSLEPSVENLLFLYNWTAYTETWEASIKVGDKSLKFHKFAYY